MGERSVALLEDDPILRSLLIDALEDESFQVLVADDVGHLRRMITGGTVNLVLADFWGVSHMELTLTERNEIRDLARDTPLILATGRAWAQTENAASLGITALLLKPFELDDLVSCVLAALPRSE